MAFKELDSEDSFACNSSTEESKEIKSDSKFETLVTDKNNLLGFEPESKMSAPLYENLFYQNTMDDAGAFPLDMPTNILEPPKEKPPPPPTDDQPDDDELLGNVSTSFILSIVICSKL